VAGDDPSAVRDASALVADLGFEPVHAGPLTNARLLEPLAMLWIDQALYRGAGRDFAFVRARRESRVAIRAP
jgi:8-hydroxy-5-deazaflavin:NADPH oxidoreductase